MANAYCAGCGKPIRWVKMKLSGKPMPLDPTPEKRIVIDPVGDEGGLLADTYTSHFATCTKAAQFRRGKE